MSDTPLIYSKIPKIMASIGSIGKTRKNVQQGYMFRGIDDIYASCNAALAEHEVFSVPKVLNISREERTTQKGNLLIYTILTVSYTFYASDGSSIECVMIGEAMDSGDKSCNKAQSAAQKYAFLQIFAIPTEEPKDTENETHNVAPKPQPAPKPTPAPASEQTVRGVIDEVSRKEGNTSGKPWVRYGVSINGEWYGTFSATLGDSAESCKGSEVVLSYKDDGRNKTIIELVPVEG